MIQNLPTQKYSNISLELVDLDKAQMAMTIGGIGSLFPIPISPLSTFLSRWPTRFTSGTANLGRISQRLVNEFYKGGLTTTSVSTWSATAPANDKAAWKNAAPLINSYLTSGNPIAGANSASIGAVQSFLTLF